MEIQLYDLYKKLLSYFGKQNWWPAEDKFEVVVGAILTQNTAWRNVEKSIKKLKEENLLSLEGILDTEKWRLKNLIRSSGFYNQKADRLKNFVEYIDRNYKGDIDLFLNRQTEKVREELLSIKGIGFETADSILLYAGDHPIFVVDAYTKRLCKRLPLEGIDCDNYEEIRRKFERELKREIKNRTKLIEIYKEFHALIVKLAKTYCKKKPICEGCPLGKNCSFRIF
ncbi:MAG TPA: endonuclease [Thermoplasmatales archaeon]|nr:endonuclease [Thermoplasmatales archaeon]HEX08738.1 endonuclease [Thermoplasmatales archaeon]